MKDFDGIILSFVIIVTIVFVFLGVRNILKKSFKNSPKIESSQFEKDDTKKDQVKDQKNRAQEVKERERMLMQRLRDSQR